MIRAQFTSKRSDQLRKRSVLWRVSSKRRRRSEIRTHFDGGVTVHRVLNPMKQTGREWGESWEEMVSWLSWLFELVYLKWASSASTLTWCCSRLWHPSIPSSWQAHTHQSVARTVIRRRALARAHAHSVFSLPPSPFRLDLPIVSDTAPMICRLAGSELSDWRGMRRLTCDTVGQDQMCHYHL